MSTLSGSSMACIQDQQIGGGSNRGKCGGGGGENQVRVLLAHKIILCS